MVIASSVINCQLNFTQSLRIKANYLLYFNSGYTVNMLIMYTCHICIIVKKNAYMLKRDRKSFPRTDDTEPLAFMHPRLHWCHFGRHDLQFITYAIDIS